MQDGPALGRRDDYLGSAGNAMNEGILAGLVEVKTVMGVLERRHAQTARQQARNELGDQRGFAGTAPAGEADDAHKVLIATRTVAYPAPRRVRGWRDRAKPPGKPARRAVHGGSRPAENRNAR